MSPLISLQTVEATMANQTLKMYHQEVKKWLRRGHGYHSSQTLKVHHQLHETALHTLNILAWRIGKVT